MRPVLAWELRSRRTSIFWWVFATVVLIAVLLLVYPSIRDQATQLNKVLNQLPAGLRTLKTGSSDVDIASPIGYLNSQLYYVTLPLLFIILAISRGSGLLGRDEQDRTLELLLARPLSRGRLLLAKAAAGVMELFIVAAVATAVTIGLARAVNMGIGTGVLVVTSLYTFLFALSFGAIAFALTAAGRFGKRMSTGIAVVVSFGGYILASLSGLTHYLVNPAKLAPYHYFVPEQLLKGQGAAGLDIYLAGVFILTILVAYSGFRSRDIG